MADERIHVAMCVDFDYILPLAVALSSLDGASGSGGVTVHVLHPGLDEVVQERIADPLSTIEISWIAVDEQMVHGAHYSTFLSRGSLYRLLLGDLLPPDVHRVLYLDADTLIVDSLRSVYGTNLEGRVVGAVRDSSAPWAAGPLGPPWRELGLEPSSPYFNSGVLLIDVGRWRTESVGQKCLDLLRRVSPRWGDQDALNVVFNEQWHELPRRYNLQTPDLTGDTPAWALWRADVEAAISMPAIIHYTGRDKPWDYGTAHPRAVEWLEWLDRTAWSGWRPAPKRQGRLEAWARTLVRLYKRERERQDRRKSFPADLAKHTPRKPLR